MSRFTSQEMDPCSCDLRYSFSSSTFTWQVGLVEGLKPARWHVMKRDLCTSDNY